MKLLFDLRNHIPTIIQVLDNLSPGDYVEITVP
jgi:hypothetical protein